MGERKKRRTCSRVGSAGRLRPPPGLSLTPSVPPPASYCPDLMPPFAPNRHRPPSPLGGGGGGGRTLGTERKKGGLSKAEERQSHTLAAAAASERVRGRAVCVCVSVCASEAWWSGCRSQGSTGSGVRPGPRAAPDPVPRDYNSQNAACPGGGMGRRRRREGASERGRDESKEQAAAKGAEPSSPGDTGRGAEEEGIAVRTQRIPESEAAVAAASRAKS